jgi:hypothetical protein
VNIEVNMCAGTSAKSRTMAAQNSTFVARTRSGRRLCSSSRAAFSRASATSKRGDGLGLVDLALRDHREALAAGGLGDVREGHHGRSGEVLAGLLRGDVEERFEAPHGSEHGERGLDVDADVAGVHRDGEGLGGGQAGVEGAVDEQAPDVAERDLADEVLDVDAAVAEGAALLVGFGDLRLERDDSLEPGYEVGHLAAPLSMIDQPGCGRRWDGSVVDSVLLRGW